jgi:peptide/nickel transport system substrate-binding protein
MNYAAPDQDILQSVYFGLAQQMKSPYASIYPMATQEFWNYETDLEKAKSLLTQAGYPDGFDTEIAINTAFPELEQVGVLLQTSLAKVGIRMQINKMPGAAFQERTSKREFPIFIQWEQANCPDPGYSLYLYYYSKSFLDISDLKDTKFDGLVDQIRSTLDDTKRQGAAKDAQRTLIQDDVPWVWLVHAGTHLAMRENISGLVWRTTNSFQFSYATRT